MPHHLLLAHRPAGLDIEAPAPVHHDRRRAMPVQGRAVVDHRPGPVRALQAAKVLQVRARVVAPGPLARPQRTRERGRARSTDHRPGDRVIRNTHGDHPPVVAQPGFDPQRRPDPDQRVFRLMNHQPRRAGQQSLDQTPGDGRLKTQILDQRLGVAQMQRKPGLLVGGRIARHPIQQLRGPRRRPHEHPVERVGRQHNRSALGERSARPFDRPLPIVGPHRHDALTQTPHG